MEAEVIAKVRKGESVSILEDAGEWVRVRLAGGRIGWVAESFLDRGGKRAGCESDYEFVEAPTPSFNERGPHGIVVVEATVNAKGIVTSTKILSNSTGDPALAARAEKEIRAAKFSPPMRNCVPRAFFFTYRRTF
jgi:TonB family protein